MQNGLVEVFADAVGLRARPGSGMIDAVHAKARLLIVCFQFAAVFRPSVGQDTDNPHVL